MDGDRYSLPLIQQAVWTVIAEGVPANTKDVAAELLRLWPTDVVTNDEPTIIAANSPDEEPAQQLHAAHVARDLQAELGQLLLPLVARMNGETLGSVAQRMGGLATSTAFERVQLAQRQAKRFARRRKVGPNSLSRALEICASEAAFTSP